MQIPAEVQAWQSLALPQEAYINAFAGREGTSAVGSERSPYVEI